MLQFLLFSYYVSHIETNIQILFDTTKKIRHYIILTTYLECKMDSGKIFLFNDLNHAKEEAKKSKKLEKKAFEYKR